MGRGAQFWAASVLISGCYTGSEVDAVWSSGAGGEPTGEDDSDEDATRGEDDPETPDGPAALDCAPPKYTPLSRLTPRQYGNSVRDLLVLDAVPAFDLPAPEKLGAFDTAASGVGDLEIRKYVDAAERAAELVLLHGQGVVACTHEDDACADTFIETLGRRAFRRPLDDIQRTMMWEWYEHGREQNGPREGYAQVVRGVLQSPQFLYHVQIGTPDPTVAGLVTLDDYEIASRLSFFLWESGPDEELLDAAERGELTRPEHRAAHAARMFEDPRTEATIVSFHQQWLRTDDPLPPDHLSEYSDDPAGLWSAMRAEVGAFATAATRDEDPDALFDADWSVMPPVLADYYGVPASQRMPTADPDLVRVEYPDGRRGGLLTLGGLLVATSASAQTSPILRGVFVVENVLCLHLAPPEDAEIDPLPDREEDQTVREWLDRHQSEPACAGCHMIIDPPGFAMQDYGADGRWRDHDGLFPVDAEGGALDVTAYGAAELSASLAGLDAVRDCETAQWMQFALSRPLPEDACGFEEVAAAVATGDLGAVVDAIVRDPSFTQRQIIKEDDA